MPDFASVDDLIKKAHDRYEASRPQASGDLGDFVGAIADNMNNSRLYSSDNHRLAHSVSRGWANGNPNTAPYFCWDSFFTANLAAVADPAVARNTVRAILSYQSQDGLVPNFAHWVAPASMDRSQPPVGSLCVWKMHQRFPDDREFLAEVYPKLVLWHDWWPKHRDGKHDGLLEWGSSTGVFQDAQYETGWDDNLQYAKGDMRGTTMDAYSIDLSSMWSMDAHYLALLARFLGRTSDSERFGKEQAAMNRRINARLWNSGLNAYCSRFWDYAVVAVPLDPSAFGHGFEGQYYSDDKLQTLAASRRDAVLDFDWGGKSPLDGVPATNWSARWRGSLTVPNTGAYKFTVSADDGVRVSVDGKPVLDDWLVHPARTVSATVNLSQGRIAQIVVEYFQAGGGSGLHFSLERLFTPSGSGAFLTRLTPMNFYALSAGVPGPARAERVLRVLTNPKKFWGQYLLPTLAYDDPDYPQQEYWRGDVWAPPDYIVWPGIKQYASPAQVTEFADRCVELFMKNWLSQGVCGENYLSTDGTWRHDPHYTWGALLDLIGLESIVDVDDTGKIVLNGAQTKTIILKNIPLLGRRYDVETGPGHADLLHDGKVILTAKGKIAHAAIQ